MTAEDVLNAQSKSLLPLPPKPATAAQLQLWEKENKVRELFVNERNSAELNDAHVLLMDVYANFAKFRYAPEDADEHQVPKLLAKYRNHATSGAAICGEAQFASNWNSFTGGLFNRFDWSNVFVAGGAVLACMQPEQKEQQYDAYQDSDIDLFVVGISSFDEATALVKRIYYDMCKNVTGVEKPLVIRTARTVTILHKFPLRHVQVVLRLYKSPAEVLLGFDIDVCAGALCPLCDCACGLLALT
jgi:hypothetical protein